MSFDLRETVADAVNKMSSQLRGIELQTEFPNDPVVLKNMEDNMRQVLMHLIGSAAVCMRTDDDDCALLQIVLESFGDDEPVRCSIIDNGSSTPSQHERAQSRHEAVERLISEMGTTLEVEAYEGFGTTVSFELPANLRN